MPVPDALLPDVTPPDAISTDVAIIGGGPAALSAAEVLSASALRVDLFEAMPSVGRKFLMAGKGGLNLTHAEAHEDVLTRYGRTRDVLLPMLDAFGPQALRDWAQGLGIETFVGTSGRVFPKDFKAAPLLRAWLHRLRERGVRFHVRHRWLGWDAHDALRFETVWSERRVHAGAVVLALGGGSWARLGSDGAWVDLLRARGIGVAPLRPANCGFDVAWSPLFRDKFAGAPVKAVRAGLTPADLKQGEFVVTSTGVEGSLIYALSAPLRDRIETDGGATLYLDLAPGMDHNTVARHLSRPRGKLSTANFLRRQAGIEGVKLGLLRELLAPGEMTDTATLATAIKGFPLRLQAARPIDEAISSAGGVRFDALDAHCMLRAVPGVFCAGEMLDWEAPTGGYLLTACFATGRHAGAGAMAWLGRQSGSRTRIELSE